MSERKSVDDAASKVMPGGNRSRSSRCCASIAAALTMRAACPAVAASCVAKKVWSDIKKSGRSEGESSDRGAHSDS
eukprot:6180773-Pleurochrysis_carterae.AAC.6